jgi:5'-AMP-activated protein kinase regulatory beta subunit
MFDEMGNVNNVIEVHEYVSENLDGLSGFELPPSPPSR